MPTHVAIESPALWAVLHRLPLLGGDASRRVEFVNIPDREARLLIESASRYEALSETPHRLLIVGVGPTVARLVVQLLRVARRPLR